jgi:hypothetical protein
VRRIALVLAGIGLVVAGSVGPTAARAKEPAVVHTTAELAVVGGEIQQPKLVWLDPYSLKQVKRGAVNLAGAFSVIMSPNRSRAASGSGGLGLHIVDVKRMKSVARVARRPGWSVHPISWPTTSRVLALEWNDRRGGQSLLVADPVSRRAVRRIALGGFQAWARTPTGVVALGRLGEGIGPASLLVVDRNGGTRVIALERIPAGGESSGSAEEPDFRTASPALAVDLAERHAYVVGQSSLVADVDLDTLAVSYRDVRRPAAITKIVSGWHRQAVALGDGRLAVAGSNYDRLRRDPAGLQLVDLQTGTTRRLEGRASFTLAAVGRLLVAGDASTGEGDWTGMGVAAYTLEGDKLWHVLDREPVAWLQAAGGYAYVVGPDAYPPTVRVIDLADGGVRTLRGQLPMFVTD